MPARKFALISGIAYLALGLASLLPALSTTSADLPRLHLETSYGLFLGLFAQNIVNKIAILLFGAAGIAAYVSDGEGQRRSILYSRAVFFVMGAAAILGAIPATSTFFGYWPLFGNEALLHGANALLGGLFGYMLANRTRTIVTRPSRSHSFSRPSLSH
jgi:hypothetical protein